ncbi:hypothetical protein [Aeromonas bivalvium]|uniref:hypothetical protein n=1 Tax=Aeromonas bivalvium TaxID=440079 RepID=UPI0038D22158
MKNLFISTVSAMILSCVAPMTYAAGSNVGNVQFTAKVIAACHLELDKEIIEFEDISALDIANMQEGDKLSNISEEFNLTANCAGTDSYQYSISTQSSGTSCISSVDSDAMRFCIDNAETEIDFTQGAATIDGSMNTPVTTLMVTPQIGSTSPTVGEYSSSIDIIIAPN